ncbi:hypothetical protein AFERRID_01010 [Acidithiobacillus ferridurans]|uniref:Uncharacterized protein n=1 Tax=Acidithiobacillus ferridurans TaxID=1232575 RepID=A0A2Z6IJD9_ACIFI|nr:hypothetical protein AFERRID_01010 [Acidithiobacillus ferridurans]
MCHNLLHDPKIFQLLYRVDEAFAEEARTTRCGCGGKWHRADYPRKPTRVRQLISQLIDIANRNFKALHYNSVSC